MKRRSLLQLYQEVEPGLDYAATTFPSMAVPFMIYEAVMRLELNRRRTEERVTVVYAEMTKLLSIMSRMSSFIGDQDQFGSRENLVNHLESLMNPIAQDIQRCAHTCDVYYKKNTLSRLVTRRTWEDALDEYRLIFRGRQKSIKLIFTSHKIDDLEEIRESERSRAFDPSA